LEGPFTVPIETAFGGSWIPPCRRGVELIQEQSPPIESVARNLRRVPRAEHEPAVEGDGPERVALRRFALKIGPERVEGGAEEPTERPGTLVGRGTKTLPPGQQHVDRNPSLTRAKVAAPGEVFNDPAEIRPLIGMPLTTFDPFGIRIPRQRVGGGVDVPGVRHRADQRAAVQNAARTGQVFADADARNTRWDGAKLAADLGRRAGFSVERVQLAPGTVDVQHQAPLGPSESGQG